jgi:flagellar basal-body rod modification protein FlgD
MIDGVSTASNTSIEYAANSKSSLDKDAFLQLMIAQLQNQDPLEPMDGSDYSAQLAQFSSLEQLQNINDSLNMSLDANYLLTQSINNTMTAGLIGKEVKIAGDTVKFEGQDETIIGYDLIAPAHELEVNIYDSNNLKVKTFDDLELEAGQYKLNWDFTDNSGNKVNVGEYRVEVKAKNLGLTDMEVAQYFVGIIDGVRFSPNGTSLVVNDIEYSISDVFEVVAGGQSSNVTEETSGEEEDESDENEDKGYIDPPVRLKDDDFFSNKL